VQTVQATQTVAGVESDSADFRTSFTAALKSVLSADSVVTIVSVSVVDVRRTLLAKGVVVVYKVASTQPASALTQTLAAGVSQMTTELQKTFPAATVAAPAVVALASPSAAPNASNAAPSGTKGASNDGLIAGVTVGVGVPLLVAIALLVTYLTNPHLLGCAKTSGQRLHRPIGTGRSTHHVNQPSDPRYQPAHAHMVNATNPATHGGTIAQQQEEQQVKQEQPHDDHQQRQRSNSLHSDQLSIHMERIYSSPDPVVDPSTAFAPPPRPPHSLPSGLERAARPPKQWVPESSSDTLNPAHLDDQDDVVSVDDPFIVSRILPLGMTEDVLRDLGTDSVPAETEPTVTQRQAEVHHNIRRTSLSSPAHTAATATLCPAPVNFSAPRPASQFSSLM
jgi:hypothetical protein